MIKEIKEKLYGNRGSNPGPPACEAGVITTRPYPYMLVASLLSSHLITQPSTNFTLNNYTLPKSSICKTNYQ